MISLTIVEGERSRSVEPSEFPLAVTLGAESALVVGPPAEADPILWILGHADGLSIQPERHRQPVRHNRRHLEAPVWLRDGDTIAIGPVSLAVSLRDSRATFTLGQAVEAGAEARAAPEPARRVGAPRARRVTPGRLVLGVFAALALAVAYVIAASPLQLRLTPEPDSLSVRGLLPAVPVGARFLVFPGDYTIAAEKDGYKPLRHTVSVPYGAAATYDLTFEKLPGRLEIATPPVDGATIVVDGRERGTSPATLEVDAGRREIRVVAERYLPEVRPIEVEGLGRVQRLEIRLQPAWGTLALSSVPDKASVRLGDRELGEAPLTVEILQGTHELTFAKDGWKPATRRVEIVAGVAAILPPVQLERTDGTLDLRSEPPGATVLVDGQHRGQTPLTLALAGERAYPLSLSKAGYEVDQRSVRVESGKTARLSVPLTPELGTIFLTTSPPGATLAVNGRPSGSATQRLTLQTLPQTLEIARPGYETQTLTVTPQRGVPKRVDVTLKTAGEALQERAKNLVTPGGQKLVLIYLPAPVRVVIGSSRRDPARRSNEVEYPIELTRSFLASEKEVTNAEFRKFRPNHTSGNYQGTSLDGADQPVVNVSWEDAARYANWLSRQEGLTPAYREEGGTVTPVFPLSNGYRLPTEAEWEFMARHEGGRQAAAQPLQYSWGSAMPPARDSGNFAHDGSGLPFAIPGYSDAFLVSAPVGTFAPNRAGLYDLGGNVSEWCHDFYDVPAADGSSRTDPAGPASGRFHVIKGASWRSGSATELRFAYRDYAEKPRDDLGFRVVRYVDPPK